MQALIVVVVGLAALGILVFIHELGHFLVAKAAGIRVLKFSLGFGKTLAGFKRGETEYVIAALPLGGFVKMAGENPADQETVEPKPGDYFYKPWWVRLLVLLAGPMMNFLAAILLLGTLFWIGFKAPLACPQILSVEADSPAMQADLRPGDVITALQDQKINDWEKFADEFDAAVTRQKGGPVSLDFMRQGQNYKRTVNPVRDEKAGRWRMGISIMPAGTTVIDRVFIGTPSEMAGLKPGDHVLFVDQTAVWTKYDFQSALKNRIGSPTRISFERQGAKQEVTVSPIAQEIPGQGRSGVIGVSFKISDLEQTVRYPFFQAYGFGVTQTYSVSKMIVISLWQMVTGKISARDSVGGPITIMRMAGQEARSSIKDFLFFLCSISIMLAIMNLLPIPVLDGGNAVFFILEGILRKPLSMKIQEGFQRVGFALLIALMVFATYNDLYKLIVPALGGKP